MAATIASAHHTKVKTAALSLGVGLLAFSFGRHDNTTAKVATKSYLKRDIIEQLNNLTQRHYVS